LSLHSSAAKPDTSEHEQPCVSLHLRQYFLPRLFPKAPMAAYLRKYKQPVDYAAPLQSPSIAFTGLKAVDEQLNGNLIPRALSPSLSSIYPTSSPSNPFTPTPTSAPNPVSKILTTLTAATTSISAPTAALSTASAPTAANKTEVFYPPAASNFALSVPAIIGVVVAGVGFLVLLAIGAAFTVCLLDRKKESKTERAERKREKPMRKETADAENPSVTRGGDRQEGTCDENADVNSNSGALSGGESAIGPRYARMIGFDTTDNANTDTDIDTSPQTTNSQSKGANNKPQSDKAVVHLPVHVSDLGTPRQSQIHYEREDPADEDRDERGYQRGASWWHPEL
jgi:hypothetical protein